MDKEEANILRLHASEIIRRLYQAGERGQLEILEIGARRSIEEIDAAMERIRKEGDE